MLCCCERTCPRSSTCNKYYTASLRLNIVNLGVKITRIDSWNCGEHFGVRHMVENVVKVVL